MAFFFCRSGRKESVMSKCRSKHACRHICAKSVRLVLEPYSRYLSSQGYSIRIRRRNARIVEHFGRWLGRRRVSPSVVQEFLDQGLPACQCAGVIRDRKHNRAALHHLLDLLGQDRQQETLPQGRLGDLLRRYQKHLDHVRGLAPDTIRRHLIYTRKMLNHLGIRLDSQFC